MGQKQESRYRGFDNLFGTGNVEAVKYRNVTECYELGISGEELVCNVAEAETHTYDPVLQSLIYRLNSAKNRGDTEKIETLQKKLDQHIQLTQEQ